MGKQLYIITLLFSITIISHGQSVKHSLISANVLRFHQLTYVYGYQQSGNNLGFKCFSFSDKLLMKDSVEFNLEKHHPSDYLEISVDTLHDVLNFYFQLANQKNIVTLLRLNDSLRKIGSAENYDGNHVNALTVFDDEKYTFKQDMYIIRTSSDTMGKQFYLSQYHVKSMEKPFEYDYKWQFAFERKFIHRASIIYSDTSQVIVYAHVFDGLKKGQWILRINANTGEVIRGTKLSAKGDSRHFLMSGMIFDKKTKSIAVVGSIYETTMIDFKNKTSNFTNQSKNHKLFLVTIDSLGDVASRVEKAFPMPIQTKAGNILQSFHLKIREFNKQADGSYSIWSDIYEQSLPNIFTYHTSWQFTLVPNDVDYDIVRSTLTISTKAITGFTSLVKGDTYGKFILNDISEYDKFKYKKPMNDVVIKTGLNNNTAFYILKKTDILSAKKIYYYVFMGTKGLESKVILKTEQGQKSNVYFISVSSYLNFITNIGNTDFELKINNL